MDKEKKAERLAIVAGISFIIGLGAGFLLFGPGIPQITVQYGNEVTEQEERVEMDEERERAEEELPEGMVEGDVLAVNREDNFIEIEVRKPEDLEGNYTVFVDEATTTFRELYLEVRDYGDAERREERESSFDQIEEGRQVLITTKGESESEEKGELVAERVLVVIEEG